MARDFLHLPYRQQEHLHRLMLMQLRVESVGIALSHRLVAVSDDRDPFSPCSTRNS